MLVSYTAQVRGTPRATRRSSSARPIKTGLTSSRQVPLLACRAQRQCQWASRGSGHRGRSGSRCGCRRHVHSMALQAACAWHVRGTYLTLRLFRRPRAVRSSGCSLTLRCASPLCSTGRWAPANPDRNPNRDRDRNPNPNPCSTGIRWAPGTPRPRTPTWSGPQTGTAARSRCSPKVRVGWV